MRIKTFLGFLLLLWPPLLLGQFTQVEGVIKDPNGFPYSNGTITATLVISGSPRFTFNGLPYTPPNQPTGLDSKGAFEMRLADVNALTPTGGTWSFHVCSGAGTVQPGSPITSGPVCFDVVGIVVTGGELDLSSVLSAAAKPITAPGVGGGTGGGGVTSINSATGALTFPNVSCASQTCSISNPLTFPVPVAALPSLGTGISNGFGIQQASLQTSGIASFWGLNTGGPGYAWKPVPTIVVNGLDQANVNGQNFNATLPAAPANGINVVWQRAIAANTFTQNISAAIVGDGVATDCLLGTGVFGSCATAGSGVGAGTAGQYAIYNGPNSVIGSPVLSSNGTVLTATESVLSPTFQASGAGQNGADFLVSSNGAIFSEAGGGSPVALAAQGGFAFLTGGVPAASLNGQNFKAVQLPAEVNNTQFSNFTTGTNFIGTAPASCPGVTLPPNGRCVVFLAGGPNTGEVAAALVGDGSSNCLSGLGTYVPCSATAGVTSINSVPGAFTFTGSGVSCAANTCTFTGAGGGVGTGVVNQPAVYNSTSTVAGSNFFTSSGVALTATGSNTIGGIGIDANGVTKLPTGVSGNWQAISSVQVNGSNMPSNLINFGGVNAMTWGAAPAVTPPTNGIVLAWGRFNSGGLTSSTVNAALVGDGVATDCLIGTGTFSPCPAAGGGGVTSINTVAGAFTFTGSGVSCASTTCTFTGTGSGIGGSGSAGFIPVFTSASALGNSDISASTQTVIFGSASPLAPTSGATLTAGLKGNVGQATPSCASGNLVPLNPTVNVGCAGMDLLYNSNNATSSGTNVGLIVRSNGAASTGTGSLGMGIAAVETSSASMTEQRAGYFEADSGQFTGVITTSRGLMGVAVNSSGNVSLNEGIVAQSGVIGAGGTNASDFSVHCLAPLLGGTLTNHACVKIEPQGTGVEFQTAAHVFANLPACVPAYEGSLAAINDSTVTAGTITGGGSNHVLAYCNGTAWTVSGGGGGATGGTASPQTCAIPNTIGFASNTGNLNFCSFNLPAVAHSYIVRCVAQIDVTSGVTGSTDADLGVSLTVAPATATKFMSTYRDPGANAIFLQDNLLNAATGNQNLTTHTVSGNVTSVAETADGVLNVPATAQTVNFYVGLSAAGTVGNLLAGSYCSLD